MKKVTQYKMEYSKKAVIVVLTMVAILFAYVLVYVWKTTDSSPLQPLIVGVMGFGSVTLAFYLEKAKKENMIKIERARGEYDENQHGIN